MGSRLDPIARSYVEACCATPFSLHEVIDCRPGRGLRLRDVRIGTEVDVIEKTGSRTLRVGDIVFAKVVPTCRIAVRSGAALARPTREPSRMRIGG